MNAHALLLFVAQAIGPERSVRATLTGSAVLPPTPRFHLQQTPYLHLPSSRTRYTTTPSPKRERYSSDQKHIVPIAPSLLPSRSLRAPNDPPPLPSGPPPALNLELRLVTRPMPERSGAAQGPSHKRSNTLLSYPSAARCLTISRAPAPIYLLQKLNQPVAVLSRLFSIA